MEVYTHRGLGFERPENTMSAFRAARRANVHLEADIMQTRGSRDERDGVLVLMHDFTVDRTTNGTGLVSEMEYPEIAVLSAGTNPDGSNEPVPRLEDFLTEFGGQCNLDLDIKDETGRAVYGMVSDFGLLGDVIFSSQDVDTLLAIKRQNRKVKVGNVVETWTSQGVRARANAGIDYLKPTTTISNVELMQQSHDNALKILSWVPAAQKVWTPGMGPQARTFARQRMAGIIVNHVSQTKTALSPF